MDRSHAPLIHAWSSNGASPAASNPAVDVNDTHTRNIQQRTVYARESPATRASGTSLFPNINESGLDAGRIVSRDRLRTYAAFSPPFTVASVPLDHHPSCLRGVLCSTLSNYPILRAPSCDLLRRTAGSANDHTRGRTWVVAARTRRPNH